MLLLLLMTTGVLVDANYHYDVPSIPFQLPTEQPPNFQPVQSSVSTGFNEENSLQSNLGFDLNSGHVQPLHATDNSNVGYASTLSPVGFTSNTGYDQQLAPPTPSENTGGVHTLAPPGGNIDVEANLLSASASSNFGNGRASTANLINFNNGLSQISGNANSYDGFTLPNLETNFNSGFDQSGDQSFNNPDENSFIPSGSVNFDIGSSQTFSSVPDAVANNGVNNVGTINLARAPVPNIMKHIYFHVPPPDIEESAAAPLPPPKKTYKILFVKVPSVESSSAARLQQQLIQNQKAGVEHKTLIYVLVKNPEDQQPVVVPQNTKSSHEVFFVNYKNSLVDAASQINDGVGQAGFSENVGPILQPRLVNGHE